MNTQKILESLFKQPLNENEGTNQKSARQGVRAFFKDPNMSVDKINAILQLVQTKITNAKLLDKYYLKGATRIFLELTNGNFAQLDPSTTMKIGQLNQYIGIIANAHQNEYNKDLNGLHYEDLDNKFKTEAFQKSEKERTESLNKQFQGGSDYHIVRIPDYETASKYARYTPWCVCRSDYAYNQYTNGGSGLFYFCLKNGFENVPKTQGENNPLDEYGLSMIAVSVDMDGNPTTITCRWNHDFDADDHVMTPQQLEDVIKRSFYGTFKPYTKQELRAKGIVLCEDVPGLLAKGVPPEKIFSEISVPKTDGGFSYCIVKLNKKYNILTSDKELLSNKWFYWLDDFHEGFAKVKRSDYLFNFIDKQGNILSNEWFKDVYYFDDGFAKVQREDMLYNFIDKQGNILSDEWFGSVYNFKEDFAKVKRSDGLCNFINKQGNIISNEWFIDAYSFDKGFAVVERADHLYNFIDKNGNFLSNKWFDWVDRFNEGFAKVRREDGLWNFISKQGNILSNEWFKWVDDFHEGFAKVKRSDGLCNFINKQGNIISNEWFIDAYSFDNGFAEVQRTNDVWRKIDKDGNLYDNYGKLIKQTSNNHLNENKKVNIKTFEVKNKLNSELFKKDENVLTSQIRMRLLDIADDFIKTLEIDWIKPLDIIITGSLVNYNWTKYSDIDIHIIYDYKKIYNKTEFVSDYFKAKKDLWNKTHTNLTIKGFPVEIGIEDVNTPLSSTAIYSLEKNNWVKEPKLMNNNSIDFKGIKSECISIINKLDTLFKKIDNETDRKKLEILSNKVQKIIDTIHQKRKKSLKTKKDELGKDNIIWKVIKHMGYVDKARKYINYVYDIKNSINENFIYW